MTNFTTIMARYTEAEQKELERVISFSAYMGPDAPQSEEEFSNWCESYFAEKRKEAETKANKEATRKANEIAKAEAMNMTVEEYRKYKNYKTQITKAQNRIAKLEKEMEEEKRKMNYYMKKIENMG